ncbi:MULTISPECIES: hypothetical protein [Sorangium]|uniref:Secreted protein n=1 Tax=Sorangium cellulosum TaxID=56 RepID=A0A4P2QMA0_SORCE|nr:MULTISPECIES: hypothetical protein [Sorangium]AUX30643.1 uncharacterized protein SOCE836_027520 [Sorangium cellulosum]WCQ90032.1 hypothetical protein NQZ70_02731 [Sorangium sp. Soce836]
MKRWVAQKLELVALIATGASLVAHGGDIPTCVLNDAESITVNVTGDCGPAGVVTIKLEDASCSVSVSGDQTGLPRSGYSRSGLSSGFSLRADEADGFERGCTAIKQADAEDTYKLSCYVGRKGGSRSSTLACEAELSPVSGECDLRQCAPLACPDGQEPRSAAGACCPVCAEPPPVPVGPCADVVCPSACPEGQELVYTGAGCCAECITQSAACFEQRDAFEPERAATLALARACQTDLDCTFTLLWTRCGPSCAVPIAGNAIGTTYETLRLAAEETCPDCLPAEHQCSSEQTMTGRPACVDGACVGIKDE